MKINHLFRNIFRDSLNSAVIIISLTVGIASINLILLFIQREFNTDSFQKNVNRIYLLKCDNPFEKGTQMSACRMGAAEYMKENFAQVEDFCRIKYFGVQKVMVNGQTYLDKPVVYEASANFFNFFTYPILTNNTDPLLETKTDIVISEALARKYFGNPSPVGQIITLTSGKTTSDFVIKGVFRKPVSNTLLNFDMVKYAQESERFAFLLLKDNTNPADLEKMFAEEKEKIPSINDGTPGKYYLKSLKQAYFDTSERAPLGRIRDISELWIALIIGLMIIGIATFNFLGLINNKLLNKTSEFNIRRINGASKSSLLADFMLENLVVIIIAFILSFGLVSWTIPLFDDLAGTDIKITHFFMKDGLLIMSGVIVSLLLIILLFSSGRINNQANASNLKLLAGSRSRKIHIPLFNISQVAVSFVLLICTFVIIKQMKYITHKDIGLDKDVIEVKLPVQYAAEAKVFKEEIQKDPSVNLTSITPASPLLEYMMAVFHYTEDGADKQYTPAIFSGDENFITTLGIKLINGRNFSGNMSSDKNNCIINESFVRRFSDRNLLGEKLPGDDDLIVIGIVSDFNYSSLKDKIEPGIIIFNNTGNHLLVKPLTGMLPAARSKIKETWEKLIPDYPLKIESVRERYEWYHRENANYAKLIGSCCLISLFLSMIGLFAISLNTSRRRTREIGIRKINGATVPEVMSLLNRDFLKWVLIAFIISVPVSWFIMQKWLENFAYKTAISWWIFALAGFTMLIIALLTVTWHAWRTATQNPVDTLKYE